MLKITASFLILFFILACQQPTEQSKNQYLLTEVASSEDQWTGVTVSNEERIFVNYPRWSENITMSVGEIINGNTVKPFPNEEWNTWKPDSSKEDHFICVQSVVVDDRNRLWVLDPANPQFQGVVKGGAKLVAFDLETEEVLKKFVFDSTIVHPNSYLNDVRIDTAKSMAYITD